MNCLLLEIFNLFWKASKNGFIIHNAPKKVVKYFKKLKKADSYTRFILFLDILKWLSTSEYTPLSNYLYQKKITDNEGKRMQIVFEYVMTNFHKNITLDEIASIASMTKNAFCRYFKVRTNKSFFQFLIEVRIERAAKLLSNNEELSVLEIAELCGFNNISNFNRKFKELKQLSPLQYRKLNL
ncbi:helix-turn-helix domain-containing protein [Flavobacterium anhuiense]|uniref:helix-turn-helix domain-containing protein n=1 Tax=Flavobacterium anhuiense TaxID=459526 RepID=UPI0032AF3D00